MANLENLNTEEVISINGFSDTTVEVRSNLFFYNTRARYANYLNCRATNIIWQPDDTEDENGNVAIPEFDTCSFFSCSFLELPENAVIKFHGKCIFYDCLFIDGQKVQIDGDCEFYNCSNVKIGFISARTYNIKAEGTSLSFDGVTSSNYTNYPVNLHINGGELVLPDVTLNATWAVEANGTKITASNGTYSAINATGCTIQTVDTLYFRKVENCTIYYSGTSNTTATVSGLSCIGCEIKSATFDTSLNSKSTVSFNAWINIGNLVQGIYGSSPIAMSKGSSAQIVQNCYNGMTMYSA